MPVLRPCAERGCSTLVERGRCGAHDRRRLLDQRRGSAASRGYDSRWAKARRAYLTEHPTCAICALTRRISAAALVDHIIPHRGDDRLFWSPENWQSLCESCHARKGILESGLRPCEEHVFAAIGGDQGCRLCGARSASAIREVGASLAG